jgi:hypothetical protein
MYLLSLLYDELWGGQLGHVQARGAWIDRCAHLDRINKWSNGVP